MIDFLSFLDESCYFMDDSGQIVLTAPIIQTEGDFQIEIPIKISSNCNTIIKSNLLKITSDTLYLSSINFETSLTIEHSKNFSISNCTIKGSTSNIGGLVILGCENAQISNVTIKDSESPGLLISNSIVTIDNLQVYNLGQYLISLRYESYVTIKNAHLHGTEKEGITIMEQTVAEITNSTFSEIKKNGIYSKDSQCIVKDSTFQNMPGCAVILDNNSDFCIENNHFTSLESTAICINQESRGTINDNTIDTIAGNGFFISHSDVLIKNNRIQNASFPAIALLEKSSATIQDNTILNIKQHGICIRRAAHAELAGNEINGAGWSGISISDTKSCFIHNNTITNCKHSSIEAFNDSIVAIKENVITNINSSAFYAFLKSSMYAENNEINEVGESLAKLELKACGEFIGNRVSNCKNQFEGKSPSSFYFARNGCFQGITNDRSRIDGNVQLFERENKEEEEKVDENECCLKCGKNKRNCFLLPCGHKSLCKECAENVIESKEECPLCRLPVCQISSTFDVNDDKVCIICCENLADCIIMPCGHVVACTNCLKSWYNSNPICPFCRKSISNFTAVYNDF